MIVTLTPNPSVDRTVTLSGELERGTVLRAEAVSSQGGGKGVNISRAAVAAGIRTIAVLPAHEDDPFVVGLLRDGIDCRPETPAGDVRVNLTLTEPDGTTTKVNTPGAVVDRVDLDRLANAVTRRARQADWVVLAGSLPPGAPDDWYAALVAGLAGTGTQVAVDTSGAPLVAVADALDRHAPTLMKPNGEELASLTGSDAATVERDPDAAACAARILVSRGVSAVLATLGASGAVLVTADGAWHATPRRPRSSARSVRATPACSATCSGTCRVPARPTGCGSPWPTAARQPPCPAPRSRRRPTCGPTSSRSRRWRTRPHPVSTASASES